MKNVKELRKETIKKLEDLKRNLYGDEEENYTEMVNIMIDYDNEAQDDTYLYDRCQELLNVVDDENLPYLFQENNCCERLFYLTGGIKHSSGIYKINDYGNLENVSNDDLGYCIDEAMDQLKEVL